MKTLFLTHAPNDTHRQEAVKQINARVKVLPYKKIINFFKRFPSFEKFFPYFSFFYSLLIKVKEDIIIVDGSSSLYTAAHLKRRNKGTKIVYIDNDTLFYNINKNPSLKENMKFFLNSIDYILSDSNQNKEQTSKVLDIPIEIWTDFPRSVKKQEIKRENYGLYVGRLDPDKDIERIIQFGSECPFFEKFIVIGDGPYENYVKKMAKLHKKIIFLGERKDVEKYYSQCKFFIHIPNYDPYSKETMEAALCGCFPIISENVGTKYLFDRLFIVKNPEDFYEVIDKVEDILDNENKAKKLLGKRLHLIPTKEKSLKQFKESFNKLIKKIEI